ncbi:expressed unknown protein [Seminavis robusta]|uniref:Uncharacterized protein n=1 Tax=Seminavis robusta TaxID=568900 RepID=A0A9N8DJK0_9STRA|nr:expressed unknown protein [Seminavis robusta]|eukprot:Sro119_g058030.1 n/a (435) ;mRNA; r:44813-46117
MASVLTLESWRAPALGAALEKRGITWESIPPKRGISIMKNETNVEKRHTILLTIPNDVLDNSKMTLSFQASTSKPISEESAGIDDLVITGFYECEESAAPSVPTVPTTAGPTMIETFEAPAAVTRMPTVEPGKPSISPTTGQPTFVETFEAPAAVTRRPSWPTPGNKLCYPEVVIVEEDFESDGSVDSWTGGSVSRREDGSQFLGLLGQGNSQIYQEFEIPLSANEEDPTEANSVTIQFSLYMLDKWTPPDKVFVVVNGISVDLGELESTSTGEPASGEAGGITWESIPPNRGISIMKNETNVEKQHTILLTIPNEVLDNSKMTLSFQASASKPISEESAGIDDLVITGFYECEESAAPSVPTVPSTSGPTMIETFEAPAAVTRMPTVEPGKPSISPTTGQPTFVETFEAPAAVTMRPSWPTPGNSPTTVRPLC